MLRISEWLKEYISETEKAKATVPVAEVDTRINAVGNMFGARTGEELQEAMTIAHFNYYFAEALSRMFYRDYEYQRGSWRLYTFADTAPDFRDVARFRMSEPETLLRRREKAEAKATYVAETEINYGVDEFARQFDISWQTLLNDDLGKLAETPSRMARAAARFEDAFVSALYDNATTQATLAGLGAPWAGTGRLTHANLAIGINAMMQRVDAAGNRMQFRRIHLVIPPILLIQAQTIIESMLASGTPNNDTNVLARYVAGVHVDPYIGFAGANVPWYLIADPSEVPAVTVARLAGVPGPWTYMKQSDVRIISGNAPAQFSMGNFATGDIEFAVEDIIGGWDDASYVGVTDFRGIYYSSGTTP